MAHGCLDVLGRPLRAETDLVLHHEHIFCDTTFTLESLDDPRVDVLVQDADLEDVRAHPRAYADNLRMGDELVLGELQQLPAAAPAIVDVTLVEIGRSPVQLRDFARASSVQIFMGCGHYVASVRGAEAIQDAAFYRDEILSDLLEGIDGVRAAVIGEIGLSNPITPIEEQTLRGAIQAQVATSAPLIVHIPGWKPNAPEAITVLRDEGAIPSRTVICHLDWCLGTHPLSYQRDVLEDEFLIAFDTWGDELSYSGNQQPTDGQRIDALLTLADEGYGSQILHSNDISTKTQLARFGGPGYSHLPTNVFPAVIDRGYSSKDIDDLFLTPAVDFLTGNVS